MRIVNIIGARPQFIKFAPIQRVLDEKRRTGAIDVQEFLIHTGQHYDYAMSEIFFTQLGLKRPDAHFGVGSGTHAVQTAEILVQTEQVLQEQEPDVVVIYGDTNSTLAGALAAAKLGIPLVHVEAGLRSGNMGMPEEINRIAADRVSSVLACPSGAAVQSLRSEGFRRMYAQGALVPQDAPLDASLLEGNSDNSFGVVVHTGDVMFDALQHALSIAEGSSTAVEDHSVRPGSYSLLTIHRAENTDDKGQFEKLMRFIRKVAGDERILFPVHPRTKKLLLDPGTSIPDNIRLIDPVGYFDLLLLLKHSRQLFTDSGGLQKEAFWLKTPCITLRRETEWIETIESGWNTLYLDYPSSIQRSDSLFDCYGDGHAAERIVSAIVLASELG